LIQEGKFCPGPQKKEQKDLLKKEDPFTVKLQMCFKRKIPDQDRKKAKEKKRFPIKIGKKREGSRSKIGRKKKKKFLTKDWKKAKEKKKKRKFPIKNWKKTRK